MLFTLPTGTSFFEVDCRSGHYLSNGVSVLALVAYHGALRASISDAMDGLDIARIRALLWERLHGAGLHDALRPRAGGARPGRPLRALAAPRPGMPLRALESPGPPN